MSVKVRNMDVSGAELTFICPSIPASKCPAGESANINATPITVKPLQRAPDSTIMRKARLKLSRPAKPLDPEVLDLVKRAADFF